MLTRKDGKLDMTRVSALVDQIAELRKNGIEVILVSSGAMASGRGELKVDHDLDKPNLSVLTTTSSVNTACMWDRYSP